MRNRRRVLTLAVTCVVAVGLAVLPIAMSNNLGHKEGPQAKPLASEVYPATVGVNDGIIFIQRNFALLPTAEGQIISVPEPTANGQTITVTITRTDKPDTYRVTSDASANGHSATIMADVFYTPGTTSVFQNALTAINGNISMGNYSQITSAPMLYEGDIYASGNISARGKVRGNVVAGGSVNGSGPQFIVTSGAPPIALAAIDIDSYKKQAASAQTGHITKPGTYYRLNGPVYLMGNLAVTRPLNIFGDIYVNGNLTVSSNMIVRAAGAQKGNLYVSGNLFVNSGNLSAAGTVYVDGNYSQGKAAAFGQRGVVVVHGNAAFSRSTLGTHSTLPVFIVLGDKFIVNWGSELHAFIYAPNAIVDTTRATRYQEGAITAKGIAIGNQIFTYRTDYNFRSNPKMPGYGASSNMTILDEKVSQQ